MEDVGKVGKTCCQDGNVLTCFVEHIMPGRTLARLWEDKFSGLEMQVWGRTGGWLGSAARFGN